jgi:hypothetical protein
MADDHQAWIDGDGRLLSLGNLLGSANPSGADRIALFERGAVALTWDDAGVRLRYAPQSVAPGALRGAIRQVRTIARPVVLERWTGTGWAATSFDSGALAADALRRSARDATGEDQTGSSRQDRSQ